ncbi:MAG: SPFH domain-containing protein [Anaerolineae bacterium]|jgi:regulator of protease activity HflC (stomatin/prohibitin superfamily)
MIGEMLGNLLVISIVLLLLLVLASASLRIVREYQRLVVFRLGRVVGQRGPGVVFLIPFVDRALSVDLREIYLEIPKQTCITKDNAPIDIDFLIYYKVTDPVATVVQVGDFAGASQGIAITTLRAVIGDIMLDDVLAKREDINRVLRVKLDEVTERWGVKVTSVEIREITPPRDVQAAMNRQLAAERERRAMVTEADGRREAAIKVADGERQATVLRAQGEREAQILKAEGFALALGKIYEVARTVDEKTLSLQYLDALTMLGSSPATKFVLPVELTSLTRPLQEYARRAWGDGEQAG